MRKSAASLISPCSLSLKGLLNSEAGTSWSVCPSSGDSSFVTVFCRISVGWDPSTMHDLVTVGGESGTPTRSRSTYCLGAEEVVIESDVGV